MNSKDLIQEAERMEQNARKLRDAADVLGSINRLTSAAQSMPNNSRTRAEHLAEFIAKHGGAATRQEIVRESGIKPGTIASLLGSKKRFRKDAHGKWHIKNPNEVAHARENGHADVGHQSVSQETPQAAHA